MSLTPAPLARRAPLGSRTPLKRSTGLSPGGPWARAVPLLPSRAARATRNSGPTREVRDLVLERDDYTCTCGCGRSIIGQPYSLGHRLRASQGGQAVPSNLLTFFGLGGQECHGRIDNRDNPQDEKNGFTVRSGTDPRIVPVTVTREDGSKVKKYLWDDGTRRDYAQPPAAGAA